MASEGTVYLANNLHTSIFMAVQKNLYTVEMWTYTFITIFICVQYTLCSAGGHKPPGTTVRLVVVCSICNQLSCIFFLIAVL